MSQDHGNEDSRQQKRLERVIELQDKAYRLLDEDPQTALAYVATLEARGDRNLTPDDFDAIRAALLVDGGTETQDRSLVVEGTALLERLVANRPDRLDLQYNLANGLSSLSQLTRSDESPWHLLTSDHRRRARLTYAQVASASPDPGLRGQALTNMANLLKNAYRWVEAYETYRDAVHADPKNGVASSGAAKLLLWAANVGLGPSEALRGIARHYIDLARESEKEIGRYSSSAIEAITNLPDVKTLPDWQPDLTTLDPYARFVAEERLALSLTVEGIEPEIQRWDSLTIHEIVEAIDSGHGVPPTFAALNALKSDYAAARWLCYMALHGEVTETGRYIDTLDYAKYGIHQSLLVLSQKAAIDVLDKVAVAATEYLGLGGRPQSVRFVTRWHRQRKENRPLEWQNEIEKEIEAGNVALVALAEVAEDLRKDGFLAPRRQSRHAGTHRLVVLHDLSNVPSRPSDFLKHEDQQDYEMLTKESLRIARAAILYFVHMVSIREARKKSEAKGPLGTLFAPPHDWIRGE
jgi:tetratricopeptide (TPR) repeat protein